MRELERMRGCGHTKAAGFQNVSNCSSCQISQYEGNGDEVIHASNIFEGIGEWRMTARRRSSVA